MSNPAKDNRLVIGGQPRADLMPPEIHVEKALRSQRRGLVAIVALSLVLVIAVYLFAAGVSQTSQDRLAAEKAKTGAIVTEETKYSAAKSLSSQVDAAKTSRLQATYLEVDWEAYLDAVESTLPSGAIVVTAVVKLPDTPPAGPVIADKSTVVADVRLTMNLKATTQIADWMDAIDSLPGFIDTSIPGFTFNTKLGGWDTTLTIHVDAAALAGRFSAKESN